MMVLVEMTYSIAQEEPTQAAVEAFCRQTVCQIIGRRVDEEAQQVQLLVRLQHTQAVSDREAPSLDQALQQHVCLSVRYLGYNLLHISFESSVNLEGQMQLFPLHAGETWFPAIHDQHQAYVCISRPLMLATQAAWLLEHKIAWEYV